MSSFYEMSVEVSGYDPAKVAEIQAAAEQEWPFDDWWLAEAQEGLGSKEVTDLWQQHYRDKGYDL